MELAGYPDMLGHHQALGSVPGQKVQLMPISGLHAIHLWVHVITHICAHPCIHTSILNIVTFVHTFNYVSSYKKRNSVMRIIIMAACWKGQVCHKKLDIKILNNPVKNGL